MYTTAFSTENYDNLLIGWATKTLQPNIAFTYSSANCKGEVAREDIINTYGWIITDEDKSALCVSLSNEDFLSKVIQRTEQQ